MERLTKKSKKDSLGYEPIEKLVEENNASPLIAKLGEIEDMLDKFNIYDLSSLENRLCASEVLEDLAHKVHASCMSEFINIIESVANSWEEKNAMIALYGKREHRGGLDESLATSKYIHEFEFNRLVKHYRYYAFDERCNQILFVAKDMKRKYTWLFIELREEGR